MFGMSQYRYKLEASRGSATGRTVTRSARRGRRWHHHSTGHQAGGITVAIKRQDLVPKLSQFVVPDSDVFMAPLVKMAERLGRQALLFRDEPNPEEPSLKGMTYCEELVFLHKLDGVKQKEYLDAYLHDKNRLQQLV